jgi:N-methylhydantoinase A
VQLLTAAPRDHLTAAQVTDLLTGPSVEVDFGAEGVHDTRVYERGALPTSEPIEGPAVVEEPACTTLVHPGQTVDVDVLGNLHIS